MDIKPTQLELPFHTGTTTESQAILQQERVKAIMAETKCTFAQACNQYMREQRRDREITDHLGLAE